MVIKILIHPPEWEVWDSGTRGADEIMSLDAKLLSELGNREKAILHFYEWRIPSATYGYLLKPEGYLNLKGVEKRGLSLARRPTGGGIVFHLWDLAFSVLVPARSPLFSLNTLDNYRWVNEAVLKAVQEFSHSSEGSLALTPSDGPVMDRQCQRFCMAQPTKFDLVLSGRKIAGAAQRKTRAGFLHQGTIALLMPPSDYLRDVLLPGSHVEKAMLTYTQPLLGMSASLEELNKAKQKLRALLQKQILSVHSQ
jgi:lipoate---protein ligase